jgi:cell division septum initiation protein DivIVA
MDAQPTIEQLQAENTELRRLLKSLREQLADERESHRLSVDEGMRPW